MRHPHLVAPHAPRPFAARRAAFPAFGEAEAAMNPVGWLRAVLIGAFAAAYCCIGSTARSARLLLFSPSN